MNQQQISLIAVGVVFTSIGTIAMIMRLLSQTLKKRTAGLDDVSIWIAYTSSVGFAVASFDSIRWGVGLPIADRPAAWGPSCFRALYAIEVCHFVGIYFTKLSVLLVYFRLAKELKNILFRGSQILTAVLTLQFMTSVVVMAVQCVPLEKYFNPVIPGRCVNITAFLYSSNTFTIVTDVIMLTLPFSTIWKAQLTHGQKVAVSCVFLSGGVSTLASCIRLYSIRIYTLSDDRIRDAAPINIYSFVELDIAICCASVAAIRPLFFRSHRRLSSPVNDSDSSFGKHQPKHRKRRAFGQGMPISDSAHDVVSDHVFSCELNRQPSATKPRRTELSMSKCTTCGENCNGKRFRLRNDLTAPKDHQNVHNLRGNDEKLVVETTEKEVV